MKKLTEKDYIDVTPMVTRPTLYDVTIKGLDAIVMNKQPDMSKAKKSTDKTDKTELEWKNWKQKLYTDDKGNLIIPDENIHQCLKDGAKYWGKKIPGEGQKTYTDVVNCSVICEAIQLGIDTENETIHPYGKNCNGSPTKGKGAVVFKVRPLIRPWAGQFKMHVFDPRLTKDVLLTILTFAGTFKGLCDWRPRFGRFEVEQLKQVV